MVWKILTSRNHIGKFGVATTTPDPSSEGPHGPSDALDEVERLVLDQQLVTAAERHIDAKLFGGREHDEDRFVRLAFRNSYHDFLIPGTGTEQSAVLEPRLLLHESGAIQLSLSLRVEGPLTTDQLLDLMWSPAPRIVRSSVPKPFVSAGGWAGEAIEWADQMDVGSRLARINYPQPVSVSDLLNEHLRIVTSVLRSRSFDWIVYPVAIVAPDACCRSEHWRVRHRQDVLRVALRAMHTAGVAEHVRDPVDLSLHGDHSLFGDLGSAVFFQWVGEPPLGMAELDTVLVFEHALLLFMRLQAMEFRVARMRLGDRELKRRFKEAILLFSQLRLGGAHAGEVRNIVTHMLTRLGADQIRPTIETALDLSGMAHSTVSAAKASSRSWWITLIASVVATLVGIPAVNQLLDTANQAPKNTPGEWILAPLRQADSFGFWGPWAVMGCIAGVLLILWFLGWVFRQRPRRFGGISRGFPWPTRILVDGDNVSNDERPDGESDQSVGGVR